MNSEEKFDRIVRGIIKNDILEEPPSQFTDKVMDQLGIRKIQSVASARPILSKWVKIAITTSYLLAIGFIIIFTKGGTSVDSKYLKMLPQFQIPSMKSLFELNSQFLTMLVVLIGVGWILAGIDKILKKFLLR